MEYESIYVYGIVDGRLNEKLESKAIGNESEVYCVPFKDVTAVVSNTPFEEYMPSEENILAHENVIQEILKKDMVIAPMRFCTILKSRNDLIKLFNSAYLAFKKNILKIRNKHEYSVKVFLDLEKFKQEIGENLVEKSREVALKLHNLLKEIAEDLVLEEQITEDMIMNCSFLIHKEQVERFRKAIFDFDKNFTDKLKIRISGPTAPYNFVSMPTKAE